MEELKKCHYCGEEILATAKKCKHCGEWLEKELENQDSAEEVQEDESEEESSGFGTRIIISAVLAGVGWALFYFGSWHLIFGKKLSLMLQYLATGKLKMQDFIIDEAGVAFRINEKYYGFAKDAHFFDSPIIQWFMLGSALVAFYYAIHNLIFNSWGSDDE
jgi:hypothetical protein